MISSVEIWIDMRDVRNRIVHDYLPDQVKNIYDEVMTRFKDELLTAKKNINAVNA